MQKKTSFILLFIITIIIIGIVGYCLSFNRELLNKNIKLASIKNEDVNLITYEIVDWNSPDDIKLLIKVTSENGLEYVKVPDENVISAQGNNVLYIDFSIKVNEEKTFVIKEKEKDEKEETIIITEEEFLSLFDKPTVSVSNITNTGYDLSYSLVNKIKPYVDSITYYLGESETDESPMVNTTGVVTELSDYTKKYVWAEIVYKYGSATRKVKSKNYCIAYTSHVHDASCYTTHYGGVGYYDLISDGDKYKDTVCREFCNRCGSKASKKQYAYLFSDVNLEVNNGTFSSVNCHYHSLPCYSEGCIDIDGNWSTGELTCYYRYCKQCSRYYVSKNDVLTKYVCKHKSYYNILVCTKPSTGYSTSYDF